VIRINLVPQGKRRGTGPGIPWLAKLKTADPFILIWIVAGLICAIAFLVIGVQKASISGSIKKVETELASKRAIVEKVRSIQSQTASLTKRKNTIVTLHEFRISYPTFLGDLASLTPEELWLERLGTEIDPASMRVTLSGCALTNYAIADLVKVLEKNDKFADVKLIDISSEKAGNAVVRRFNLTAMYSWNSERK